MSLLEPRRDWHAGSSAWAAKPTKRPQLQIDRRLFRTFVRLLAWLVLVAIAAVTLSPLSDRPHLVLDGANFERALGFVTLGCLFSVGYGRHRLLVLCFVVFAAIGLELAQLFVADRHARVMDAEVKTIAGALGVVVGSLVADVIRRRRHTT